MVIVLSVDTGALIVATIVTMLPLDSATIIKPPRCVFRPRMNRFWYIRKIRRKSTMVPILFCSHWNRQNRSRETQVLIWKYYKICSTAAHWIGYFPLEYLENRQSVSLWTWNWMSSGYQIGSKQRWIRHPDDGSKSQTVGLVLIQILISPCSPPDPCPRPHPSPFFLVLIPVPIILPVLVLLLIPVLIPVLVLIMSPPSSTWADPTSRRWKSSFLQIFVIHPRSLESPCLREHSFLMLVVVWITEQCLPKASSVSSVKLHSATRRHVSLFTERATYIFIRHSGFIIVVIITIIIIVIINEFR